MNDIEADKQITLLVEKLRKSQFIKDVNDRLSFLGLNNDLERIKNSEVLTREKLQSIPIEQGSLISSTSGSTGKPVVVSKTLITDYWFKATTLRELEWRNWQNNKNYIKVVILARNKQNRYIPELNTYLRKLDTISNIKEFLYKIQPHYIVTYPSIVSVLDKSKFGNLIDCRTVGEIGATSYSCEEAGTIALMCPKNKEGMYHIMENIIVENDPVHGILISDLTNPLITRYALGDKIELCEPDNESKSESKSKCECGKTLPMIKKIHGRTRNMLKLPGNDSIWPTIGEPKFNSVTNKIIRHQAVQTDLFNVVLYLKVKEQLSEKEHNDLLNLVKESLNQPHIDVKITYINDFPKGKFEAFKCLI